MPRKLVVEEQLSDYDGWRAESAIPSFKRAFGEHGSSLKRRYLVNDLLMKASIYNPFMSARL